MPRPSVHTRVGSKWACVMARRAEETPRTDVRIRFLGLGAGCGQHIGVRQDFGPGGAGVSERSLQVQMDRNDSLRSRVVNLAGSPRLYGS
jgi:hypothetical protein